MCFLYFFFSIICVLLCVCVFLVYLGTSFIINNNNNNSKPANLIEPTNPFQTWILTQASESHQPVSPAGTAANSGVSQLRHEDKLQHKQTVYDETQKKIRIKGKDTRFSNSVGMGILWVFPQVSLWVWDRYAD